MIICGNYIKNNNFSFRAKPIPKEVLSNVYTQISNPEVRNIDIHPHLLADEDAINSAKLIYDFVQKMGKKARICIEPKDTQDLFFNSKNYRLKRDNREPDMHIVVDFNSIERFSQKFLPQFNKTSHKPVIIIDHHNPNDKTININHANSQLYIDESANSCSGIIFRLFEGLGKKLTKADAKNLYCGMLSDYLKSKLITIEHTPEGAKLVKLPELHKHKESKELLEKIEAQLDTKTKQKIYNHLDFFSHLDKQSKAFMNHLPSMIQVSPNGKLAYVLIEPDNKDWATIGMDTNKNSKILSNLRTRMLKSQQDSIFSPELKEKLKQVQIAMVFYKTSPELNEFKMSVHSNSVDSDAFITAAKSEWAKYLAQTNQNIPYYGGGHPDRAGGKILSCEKQDAKAYVNCFLTAIEKTN